MALTKVSSGLISADASSVDLNIDAGTLYIDATNNNVGIGTTSPLSKLHINSGASSTTQLLFGPVQTSSDYAYLSWNNNAGSEELKMYSDGGFISFYANATERMRIDSSGRLAINTTDADNKQVRIVHADGTPALCLSLNSGTGSTKLQFGDSGDSDIGQITYDHTSNFMALQVNNSERMRIDSSGNVGIGVTPVSAEGSFLQFGSQYSISQRGFGRNTYFDGSNYRAITTSGATLIVGGDDHLFYTASSVSAGAVQAFTERMKITSTGNVGIGESAPANKLHVKVDDIGLAPIDTAVLVLEKSGTNYINFMGSTTSTQGLRFGDSTDTGAGYLVYNHTDNSLQIGTNGPEKVRIDSSGDVMIGTTASIGGATLTTVSSGNTHQAMRNSAATAGEYWRQEVDSSNDFYLIDNNSTGVYITDGSTSWSGISDENLKENIVELTGVLDKVKNYRCVEYNLIADETKSKKIGFIAQDWQEDYSQVVSQDNDGNLGMKYTETIPVLLKAIQEQQVLIEQLQAEVALLKGE